MLKRCAAVSASMATLMLVGAGLAWAGDDGWGGVHSRVGLDVRPLRLGGARVCR
jgi:hypothetical protein